MSKPTNQCCRCKVKREEGDFSKNQSYCKSCARYIQKEDFEGTRLRSKKCECKRRNITFDLKRGDLHFPTHCPILGVELDYSASVVSDNSPSLDRIIPSLGYTKGNVQVISNRANTLKNNATIAELNLVIKWMEINQ